jgi:hypothetical protein
MKWFDTAEVKAEDSLTSEQVGYIKDKSFTIFGPLNVLVRKHWDILVAYVIIRIVDNIVMSDDSMSSYVLALLELAFIAWLFYFAITNGRRLAWNRNNWRDFEDFKKSEENWTPWGYLMFILIILIFAGEFLSGYLGL